MQNFAPIALEIYPSFASGTAPNSTQFNFSTSTVEGVDDPLLDSPLFYISIVSPRFLRGVQLYFGEVAVQADWPALTAFIGSRVQLAGMLLLPVLWSLEPNQRVEVPLVYLTGQGHQGRQPKGWLQSGKKPQCNCAEK
ncbi:hypothetical protein B0H16DRAFT_1460614 [Mycena metata]|uniref:Uncharacterized protein n=1 Tax=Mycena metata TaxID=1033252 RepID=A0AAD7IW23_9AGAR|nr:hypothetical protein B0H16DRAFT_1460614 [Mycena metata]